MVKDSVKFLVDTMLKNDEEQKKSEDTPSGGGFRHRLSKNANGSSADSATTSTSQDNRSDLCLC